MLASEKKRYDELRLRLYSNSMLNVEEFKELRYLGLRLRLYSNSMLNVEEYSEFLQLHTQFQDSKKDIYDLFNTFLLSNPYCLATKSSRLPYKMRNR